MTCLCVLSVTQSLSKCSYWRSRSKEWTMRLVLVPAVWTIDFFPRDTFGWTEDAEDLLKIPWDLHWEMQTNIYLYFPKTLRCPVAVRTHGYVWMRRIKSFLDLPPADVIWAFKCKLLLMACVTHHVNKEWIKKGNKTTAHGLKNGHKY